MNPVVPQQFDYIQYRRNIQKAINEKAKLNPPLVADGALGTKTIQALQLYQKSASLPTTGIYDAATQAALDPFIVVKYLTKANFAAAAKSLSVEVPAIMSVCETETAGSGFFADGTCQILFEPHQFYIQLQKTRTAQALSQLVATYPTLVNPGVPKYLGGPAEYGRLKTASTIDPHLALMSASWGLFQIMGFNFASCGYGNVEKFVADMKMSEGLQLQAFVKFVQTYKQGSLLAALRAKNWTQFALIYNGTGYAKNQYDVKLKNNYDAFNAAGMNA